MRHSGACCLAFFAVWVSGCGDEDPSDWTYPHQQSDKQQLTALVERYEEGLEAQDAEILCEDVVRFDVSEQEMPTVEECVEIWTDILEREDIADPNYDVSRIRFPPNQPVVIHATSNGKEKRLPQIFYEAEDRWWIRPFN